MSDRSTSPSRVAARYITAREHYYAWVRNFPNVDPSSFAAMQQHADHEGTEVNDDPRESLKMIVFDMGWSQSPLPTNKRHWVWEIATALKVDIKKEHATGSASRGGDD